MENVLNLTFRSKTALQSSAALFLDRFGFYGIRSIIVIYFINTLNYDQTQVYNFYGHSFLLATFFGIIGALIGDLTKNKTVSIIAMAGMVFSCCVFAIENKYSAIIGLIAYFIFSSVSSVNLKSIFTREHQPHSGALDTGFTFLYLAINIAAFLGGLIIGLAAEKLSYSIAFLVCAVAYIAGALFVYFSKPKNVAKVKRMPATPEARWLIPITIGIFMALFWMLYELSFSQTYLLFHELSSDQPDGILGKLGLSLIQSGATVVFGISLIALWLFLKINSFIKMAIGFTLVALAVLFLLFMPDVANNSSTVFIIVALSIMALGELLISPIAESIIARFVHPKWLATAFAISYLAIAIGNGIFSWIQRYWYEWNSDGMKYIGIVLFLLLGISCLLFGILYKPKPKELSRNHSTLDFPNSNEKN